MSAAVRLTRVTVRYGSTTALHDVDLCVRSGERVALLGPSGAGKSTLLGLLHGRVRPDSGTVSVLGTDLVRAGEPELRRLRRRIGALSQGLDLVGPLRVVHNVNAARLADWSFGRALWSLLRPRPDPVVEAALERVGLGDRAFARTDALSGGEQQRVALARLLVASSALVLADEPVSSLDPGLAEQILQLLVGATEGTTDEPRTLVLSLHDPGLARRFTDRLIGLRDGRVVFDLPSSEVDADRLARLYAVVVP